MSVKIFFSSLYRPTGLIQSLSCNVHDMCVCMSVLSGKTRFPIDWRLLVEEHNANIGITLDVFEPAYFAK